MKVEACSAGSRVVSGKIYTSTSNPALLALSTFEARKVLKAFALEMISIITKS